MNSKNKSQNHKIIEQLELPQDILLGVPIISLQGNIELMIENHRGLLQYEAEEIKVRTKQYVVNITGKNLKIQEYRKGLLIIRGQIEGMQFVT